jgi:hypothetical protein
LTHLGGGVILGFSLKTNTENFEYRHSKSILISKSINPGFSNDASYNIKHSSVSTFQFLLICVVLLLTRTTSGRLASSSVAPAATSSARRLHEPFHVIVEI